MGRGECVASNIVLEVGDHGGRREGAKMDPG